MATSSEISSKAPIASVGMVNTKNGYNKLFGNIFNCWERGDGTNFLCERITECWEDAPKNRRLKIVHTSEEMSHDCRCGSRRVGHVLELHADQSGRDLGRWTIISMATHREEGLQSLGQFAQQTSIVTCTFK